MQKPSILPAICIDGEAISAYYVRGILSRLCRVDGQRGASRAPRQIPPKQIGYEDTASRRSIIRFRRVGMGGRGHLGGGSNIRAADISGRASVASEFQSKFGDGSPRMPIEADGG